MRLIFSHDCDTVSLTSDRHKCSICPKRMLLIFFSPVNMGRFLKLTEFSLSIDTLGIFVLILVM